MMNGERLNWVTGIRHQTAELFASKPLDCFRTKYKFSSLSDTQRLKDKQRGNAWDKHLNVLITKHLHYFAHFDSYLQFLNLLSVFFANGRLISDVSGSCFNIMLALMRKRTKRLIWTLFTIFTCLSCSGTWYLYTMYIPLPAGPFISASQCLQTLYIGQCCGHVTSEVSVIVELKSRAPSACLRHLKALSVFIHLHNTTLHLNKLNKNSSNP